jgi:type I restriction enzyme S subunit
MSIDKVPDGWTRVKFGDVVRNSNENSRNLEADGIDRVIGLDHLDPGSLRLARWDNLAELPDGTTFTRKFKPGQVLFGKRRAYQRKVAVPDFEGVCSGDILVFEPADKRMLAEFLPYVVQSDRFFDHALGTSAGSLSPRTKWAELAKYEFALPPLDEQQRMVETFVACDRKTEALLLAAESAVSLALSTFDSLVSTADVPVVQLDSVAEWRRGYSFKGSDYADDEGFPFLTLASVDRGGGYRTDGLKYLKTEPKASCIAVPGDLLVANTDLTPGREFIGRPFLVPESLKTAGFSHHLSRIMTEDESLREWLFWELQSPSSRKFVRSVARGSTVIMLDTRALGKWPVRVPPARTRAEVLHRIRLVMTLELKARGQLAATANLRTVLLSELVGGGGVH